MFERQIDDDVAALHMQLNQATQRAEELVEQTALARKRQMESDDRAKGAARVSDFWNATLGQLSDSDDVHLTLEYIVLGLAREIGAVHVFLFRHSAATRQIRLELSCMNGKIRHGLSGEELPLWAVPFPDDITPAWEIMVRNRGLFTPNMTTIPAHEFGWPGAYEYIERFKLSDVGHIVLFAGSEPVGSIGFGLDDGRKLSSSDKPFIEDVAKQAALAIRLLDLTEQAQQLAVQNTEKRVAEKRAEELFYANEAMRKGVKWLVEKKDLRIFLGEMLKAVAEAVGAHAGAVVLLNENATAYRFAAVLESSGQLLVEEGDLFLPIEISPELKVYMGEMLRTPNGCPMAPDDPIMTSETRAHHIKQGNRALRHVPMRAGERLIGWIGLGFANPEPTFEEAHSLPQVLANQMAMAVEMIRLAEEAEKAAVARERERAAIERAAELSKANDALRACMTELVSLRNADQFLATFLRQSVTASGALAGAVLTRLEETEFEFVFVSRDGEVLSADEAVDPGVNREVRAASSLDPTGHFARLSAGIAGWRHREDQLSAYLPRITQYHREIGTGILYDFPFGSDSEVTGYLGLAFPGNDAPSQVIQELLTALSTQVGLALELTRLSHADKAAAIALERERAAQERADELAKANIALRLGIERVIESQTVESLIETFLDESRKAVDAQGAAVMLRVEGTKTTFKPAAVCETDSLSIESIRNEPYLGREFEDQSSTDPAGIFASLARGETPAILVADLKDIMPDSYRYHRGLGHSMIWHAPLILRESVVGYIALAFRKHSPPSAAAKETVMALAQQLVLALELSRLAKVSEESAVQRERDNASLERAAELAKANQALRSVNAQLTSDLDLKQFLGFVLAEATNSPKADAGAVFLLDGNGNLCPAQWWESGKTSEYVPGYPYPAERPIKAVDWSLWGTLCAERVARVMQVKDYYGDALAWHISRDHARVVVAPLLLGSKPLGFLGLAYKTDEEITEPALQLISALAEQTTLAVRLTQLATIAQAEAVSRTQQEQAQARVQRLAEENRALQSVADALAKAKSLDEIVPSVLTILSRTLGSPSAAYYEIEGEDIIYLRYYLNEGRVRTAAELIAGDGKPPYDMPKKLARGFKLSSEYFGPSVRKNLKSRVIDHRAGTSEAAFDEWRRLHNREMELNIPLCAGDEAFGSLTISRTADAPYSANEIELAETLVKQLSLAVQAYRLAADSEAKAIAVAVAKEQEKSAKARADELAALNQTIGESFRRIATQSETFSAPPVFLSDIASAASAELCYWLDYDPLTDQLALSLRCKNGVIVDQPEPDEPDIFSSPLPAASLSRFFEVSGSDAFDVLSVDRDGERLWPATAEWHRRAGRKQVLCFAVTLGDRPIGMLGMAFREETDWSATKIELIRSLANHLALSVHLCRLSEQATRGAAIEERTHLAREIHDTLAQGFSGILAQLRAMQHAQEFHDEVAQTCHLENALELANSGLAEARRSLASLRSLELEGRSLREALKLMAEFAMRRGGIPIVVKAELDIDIGLENEAELLRIAQESVTNALKHSGATQIVIALRHGTESADLCIEDNGKGFDLDKTTEGFGLIGMQERAAKIGASIKIESSHLGTSICVSIRSGN